MQWIKEQFVTTFNNDLTWDDIMAIVIVSFGIIIIVWKISRAIANSLSPMKTSKVFVYRLQVQEMTNKNGTLYTYYATFSKEDGEHIRMYVSKKIYYSLAVGDVGILTRKGTRFISFHSLNGKNEQQISG